MQINFNLILSVNTNKESSDNNIYQILYGHFYNDQNVFLFTRKDNKKEKYVDLIKYIIIYNYIYIFNKYILKKHKKKIIIFFLFFEKNKIYFIYYTKK